MVEKTPGLEQLREELLAACGSPKLSRKEFTPHVTLANVVASDFEKIVTGIGDLSLLKSPVVPCKTGRV
jgi:2'-5' RNA ligase